MAFICQKKNQLHPYVFLGYCKILQTCYTGYFGHVWLCTYYKDAHNYFGNFRQAWLYTPKAIVLTWNKYKTWMFIFACQKYTSPFTYFLRHILKNLAIWLANSNLAHNLRTWISGINGEISITILVFILDYFQQKIMTIFFKKSKNPISRPFWTLFAKMWARVNFAGDSNHLFQLSTTVQKQIRKN